MTLNDSDILFLIAPRSVCVCVCVCVCTARGVWRCIPATHPVDEDVSWQSSGGLLQAAEAIHHPAAVKGQCDLWQTTSCTT